jgi:hypothetical protein
MSWDVAIFSSKQKITSVEEINEDLFVPIDFNSILERHFDNIIIDENHRKIKGTNYSIEYFAHSESVSNVMFSLYGEAALFELIRVAKIYGLQIFDTGNGEMLDLEHPEKNGYDNFRSYLQHVLTNPNNEDTK